MLSRIFKIIRLLGNLRLLKRLTSMAFRGYLKEVGWINSFVAKSPIDSANKPLPWVTYPFIDFISDRLVKSMNIFEYGSGNSTLWYADKVNTVTSAEHDRLWFERIKSTMPENVDIYYRELVANGEYSNISNELNGKFDIVIVDGRDRVNCIKKAIHSITESGVIVLDDSERERYIEGVEFLVCNGFKRLDFWGISPGLFYKKNTTIFYKENNCLSI